jgi:hypothetical protein
MLLAHLCGEGEKTETRLRGMGLGNLESVAATDPERLIEGLGINVAAAERMIEEAKALIESGREAGPPTLPAGSGATAGEAGVSPMGKEPAELSPEVDEESVTVVEMREIRRSEGSEGETPTGG